MKKVFLICLLLIGCQDKPIKQRSISPPSDEADIILTNYFPDRDGLPGTDNTFKLSEYNKDCCYAYRDDMGAIVAVNNGYGGVDANGDGQFELVRKVVFEGEVGRWVFCRPSQKIDWYLTEAAKKFYKK